MDFEIQPKMEKGVYLPSPNQDSGMMVRCLQVLLNTYPTITFTSITFDEKVHGYKIYFSKPDEADVLEKNYLVVGNDHVWIYPLTSYLTVHNVIQIPSPQFKSDLQDAIENKLGKLLHVEKLEKSPNFADWRIQIDVPEFKGLKVFCEENFDLEISLTRWNEKLKTTFWCRSCKQNNHFQHECGQQNDVRGLNGQRPKPRLASLDRYPWSKLVENPQEAMINFDIGIDQIRALIAPSSSIPDVPAEELVLEDTTEELPEISRDVKTVAENIGREAVMNSGIISEGNLKVNLPQTNNDVSSSSPESKKDDDDHSGIKIKKEKNEERAEPVSYPSENKLGRECRVVIKREPCTSPIRWNEDSLNNSFLEPSPSSNDDDIQFVPINRSPTHILPHDSNSGGGGTGGRDENCNSEVDASRSPINIKKEFSFPSFSDADASFSPSSSVTPAVAGPSRRSKPVARVEVTSVLSDRLQECINDACDTCQVLDRKTLDAFLIHVKKKSNPVRVALNFTKNASDLKGQLKQILHLYYNTPQTGTKEDMQFIKWLNGLVDRFDGTIPRKRKRNECSDESPLPPKK